MDALLRHKGTPYQLSYITQSNHQRQNFTKLASILTPIVHIDLSSVLGSAFDFPNQPAEDYVAMISAPNRLGNPFVATQHLLGASTWARTAERNITATYQVRAQNIRFADNGSGGRSNVQLRAAVTYATVDHHFFNGDDGWKLAGLKAVTLFNDGNATAVFN